MIEIVFEGEVFECVCVHDSVGRRKYLGLNMYEL